MPALQTLQIVRQLHDAAHQHRIGLVLRLDVAIEQALRDALHFLDHHRRAVQFDHAQRALHLVQIGGAEAHQAGVGRILDVGLERLTRLLQGLVELLLDPVEGGEIDIVLQFHEDVPAFPRCTGTSAFVSTERPEACAASGGRRRCEGASASSGIATVILV